MVLAVKRSLLIGLALALVVGSPSAVAAGKAKRVASFPVTFSVQNVDRTKLPCGADGAAYQIKGHLTGPRSTLARSSRRAKRAVTLYVHGLGFGEWFWHFTAVPGHSYALAQAKSGHVSLTFDRLGYDASGHPDGKKSCLGGQADIAHQLVQALRKGSYTVEGGKAVRFKKVALVGHSIGAEIAMLEAYSFRDIDALADASFSYLNLPRAQVALGPTRDSCLAGGQPAEPGTPSGYSYYGQPSPADFQAIMFHSADKSLIDAATPLRNRDPCGDIESIIPALLQQRAFVPKIKVPVLVICGTDDALYSPLGCSMQADRFTGSRRVSNQIVRNAGHALTFERTAASFRRKVSRWLEKYGF
jgi:pimeloyl-ACP methyl ester carboxylesterase